MILKISGNRITASNGLTSFFIIILVFSALYSEFFQAPTETNHEFSKYQSLFQEKDLINSHQVSLHNNRGTFIIKKKSPSGWNLVKPRELPSPRETINTILKTLEGIKIRKIYSKDSINLANFSLDAPTMNIELIQEGQFPLKIFFGLVNPIDNSTYLMTSNKEVIYHVDQLNSPIEKLGLADFVDSHIFSIQANDVKNLKIFKGANTKGTPLLEVQQGSSAFKNKQGHLLRPGLVNKYLNELFSLKSVYILDKVSKRLQESLEKILKNPSYLLLIETKDKQKIEYKVSHLIKNLPDLKIEKKQNFIIQASNRNYPLIVDKNYFKLFKKRNSAFKKLPFKKLFY